MAIIAGRIWHANDPMKSGLYLILLDLDNEKAIDEVCTTNGILVPLSELAKKLIVEQHDDAPDKAHILFYASHAFPKKSSDAVTKTMLEKLASNEIPAIEVKGSGEHGILFVTPSVNKNGYKYRIIGTRKLGTSALFDAFESRLDEICNKYNIPYLTTPTGVKCNDSAAKPPIKILFSEDTKIYEGHNRHEAILRIMESLLRRNRNILTHEHIKRLAAEWNQEHSIPPLDDREFEKQWRCAINFIANAGINTKARSYPELQRNVYYQLNEKPEKYIIAYRQKNKVIEATVKQITNKSNGGEVIEKFLFHNKTYLACIPVTIIRHKSPLKFLESSEKYTISFIDSISEKHTFKQKTLSEIIQLLRNLGYVLSDGADMALAGMIQAFKENKLIENNEDIEWVGFFHDKVNNRIIASNLEIRQPNAEELLNAISLIIELKSYYENRLDLLATALVWGMVAPVIFMLKTNNYFLKALHFYGFPNATKSNTGKIVLCYRRTP